MNIPHDFCRPTFAYRVRVWLAMLGLLAFLLLYLGLAIWFSLLAIRMLMGMSAGGESAFACFFSALPPLFFALFLWKALFFRGSEHTEPGIEISRQQEPRLFESLNRLVHEIGAPKPHRVYLSPHVTAAVFYDLSVLNLFLPTKKSLIIGLGLVNCLNRSEFGAVLAHEFGHFSQRSMAVGRYVYLAESVAQRIIASRDVFDRFLDAISSTDLRIAWIGWIMRTIVWSLRSILETVFRWVVVAQRALSREMEFHADLVAVSQCGSDALVHALYKLQAADQDWDSTVGFVNALVQKKKTVADIYTIQSQFGIITRRVLDDPWRGRIPPFTTEPSETRLFTTKLGQPPKMWSTHPPNDAREENAKRFYLPGVIDDEPAWTLFADPQRLRQKMTQFVLKDVELPEQSEVLSDDAVIAEMDRQFNIECYAAAYRGAYRDRKIALHAASANDMVAEPLQREEIQPSLDALYPETLSNQVKDVARLTEEIALLRAVDQGVYEASENMVRHQGQSFSRSTVPSLLAELQQRHTSVVATLEEHDRQCRRVHRAAARYVAPGWQDYLDSLYRLLHYAEHSEANLSDALDHLQNVTYMITVVGRPSAAEVQRVLRSANDLHEVMWEMNQQKQEVELPPRVLAELESSRWAEKFQDLELPPATLENLGSWMDVIHSWALPMLEAFCTLRIAALNELLRSEREVATQYAAAATPAAAPACAVVPGDYGTRVRGTERPKQQRLDWWRRFTLADGKAFGALRLAVASSIFGLVVYAGTLVGQSKVVIYNGLQTTVVVEINRKTCQLSPLSHQTIPMGNTRHATVRARVGQQMIDEFHAELCSAYATYVYNIAQGALLTALKILYSRQSEVVAKHLGNPRWTSSSADYVFSQAPSSIRSDKQREVRRQLTSINEYPPFQTAELIQSTSDRDALIRAHVRWDATDSQDFFAWAGVASGKLLDLQEILEARLAEARNDYALLRLEYDLADISQKAAIRARHRKQAAVHPDDPSWQSTVARYETDGDVKTSISLQLHERWPDHPACSYAAAFAYAKLRNWDESLRLFEQVMNGRGPLTENCAIYTARIRRLTVDTPANVTLDDLPSRMVAYYHGLEFGNGLSGTPDDAYQLLTTGKLQEANDFASRSPSDARLAILIGASAGATEQWQQRAMEIPLDELTDPVLVVYLATIAKRRGQPIDDILHRAEQLYDGVYSPLQLIQVLWQRFDDELESRLQGVAPDDRGVAYTVACLLYPEQADQAWRDFAKRVLFPFERPHF